MAISVRPVAADEPVALIVVADTSNERGWLPPGPKYANPLLYLRDTIVRLLKELPLNGRYAVYTMASGSLGTPSLADRASAENAAAQLQLAPDARLLERIEQAVEALKEMPPEWRRIVVVLSDGNSAIGRPYEVVQGAAALARVAVFAVGTLDANNPFRFLERMAQETGGQAWLFEKANLQPGPESPVLLDLLVDQVTRAIKNAYRLEYTPISGGQEQRELVVTVKTAAGEARSQPVSYRPGGGSQWPLALLFGGVPVLAAAAGGAYYYLRLRPVKTEYYLVGHGPSAAHVPQVNLYTNWRPLGRGGPGYQLDPTDPHFDGLSRTHVYLRVRNLRRIQTASGTVQQVGTVEVRAGRPSSGKGLNRAYVFNSLTRVRPLSEKPYQLAAGDLLILQPAWQAGKSSGDLPAGVHLQLAEYGGTVTEGQAAHESDPDETITEDAAASGPIAMPGAPAPPRVTRVPPTGLNVPRPPVPPVPSAPSVPWTDRTNGA